MKHHQAGATLVEFSLVFLILLMFLLGLMDFARMLYTWNAANEATRAGARYAVVCDDQNNGAAVLAKMQALLPQITSVSVAWDPVGCNPGTCEGVSVGITGLNFQWISPIIGAVGPRIALPTFRTYLPREIMRQDANSSTICQ